MREIFLNDAPIGQNFNGETLTVVEESFLNRCRQLGLYGSDCRNYNEGKSNYSQHLIQPWSIWQDYNLDPWDADIIKRVLRTKQDEPRELDYKKIIHICREKLRQLNGTVRDKD